MPRVIVPTTTARFICPECDRLVEANVEVPEVDWNVDRLSDSLSEDDADMECPACKAVFSVHVQNSPSHCAIEMHEHPDVQVDADDAPFAAYLERDDDEWLNPSAPPAPYEIFSDACHHLEDVLAEYGEGGQGPLKHSASLINRMTFAQSVSALEAYLGDTLVNAVMSQPVAMRRLIEKDKELSEMKLGFVQVLDDPNIVSARVQHYLRELLYHNLAKIEVIYKISLGVDIFPNKELKARLFKAVLTRHDIVHRNGRDKNDVDAQLPSFLVAQVISDIRSLVDHVERRIQATSNVTIST